MTAPVSTVKRPAYPPPNTPASTARVRESKKRGHRRSPFIPVGQNKPTQKIAQIAKAIVHEAKK